MGRPRQLFMTRFLRQSRSTGALVDDSATQCTNQLVRKLSLDAMSVTSDTTQSDLTAQSERSLLPQHFESERSCCNDSVTSLSRRAVVGFGNVQVRQYEQVIGDHPHCSSGCPLTLGWAYVQDEPESIADFESHKNVRTHDELRLSDEERHDRLVAHEVSDLEIRRMLRRLHRERECSIKCQMKAKAQFFI